MGDPEIAHRFPCDIPLIEHFNLCSHLLKNLEDSGAGGIQAHVFDRQIGAWDQCTTATSQKAAELMSPGTTTCWPVRVAPGRTLMCRPISPPTSRSAPKAFSIRSLWSLE